VKSRRELNELAIGEPGRTPIHPQYAAKVLDEVASDSSIFMCDVGTPTIWASRYLKDEREAPPAGFLFHGSMASALPLTGGLWNWR
jgi:pyruvate dehydrogenase (quinone)